MKLVPENINEAIKHLTPQTDEKIATSVQELPYFDQFKLACKEGMLWLVKKIIEERNIDPDFYNYGLTYACQNGRSEIVKYLLSLPETDPTDLESVALRTAVYYRHSEVVKILLKDGRADPTASDLELIRDTAYNVTNTRPTKKILDMLMKDKRFSTAYFKFIRSKRFKNNPNYRPDSETYEV